MKWNTADLCQTQALDFILEMHNLNRIEFKIWGGGGVNFMKDAEISEGAILHV